MCCSDNVKQDSAGWGKYCYKGIKRERLTTVTMMMTRVKSTSCVYECKDVEY